MERIMALLESLKSGNQTKTRRGTCTLPGGTEDAGRESGCCVDGARQIGRQRCRQTDREKEELLIWRVADFR